VISIATSGKNPSDSTYKRKHGRRHVQHISVCLNTFLAFSLKNKFKTHTFREHC